ncbi:N-acetylneuraminate synthase family protein [Gracilibacillus sp. YIM 98692]|uniref:N-acetylneuraminate synthase family protein n=1 Tax=Gracilibacillus sp. YIM 98692 TaxID=2663532 RepID=UPI001F08A88E|nr:N-acetylneuraminate synthase family protein [Gracilibacillus sp. YIM 98692]
MNFKSELKINNSTISLSNPSYFIADIASNHDGDLNRAKELIWLCKEAEADAVKFQHFTAEGLISQKGFDGIENASHQSNWHKSVFDVFKDYELNRNWNLELMEEAKKANIDFLTTPYDLEAVDELDQYLPAYKIGSGDITYTDFIKTISRKNKPMLMATGASDIADVERAVHSINKYNEKIVLMQCNTNYTNSLENFHYINLNVLKLYTTMFPNVILGLSDHTPGHSTVLGAIALGARVIEKHFTDDNERIGPDHPFSMNPKSWKEMVERSRELEQSLGDGVKKIEKNEEKTAIIQRRACYLKKSLKKGDILKNDDVDFLRPATVNAIKPYEIINYIGKKINSSKEKGEVINKHDMGE